MFRAWLTRRIGVGVALLALSGCDSDGESERVRECRKVCEKLDMCRSETDLAECEQRCDEQTFRSDLYYRLKSQCVSEGRLSCDQWAHELDFRGDDVCPSEQACNLKQCVDRKLLDHALNEEQKEYCRLLADDLFSCDRTLNPDSLAATCMKTLPQVSPEYAAETEDCVNLRCLEGTEFRRCFDELSLKYNTQIRIFGL